jgi:surface protein
MKSLAAGTEKAYNAKTSDIKAIRMASALPNNFVATEANTVSTNTSRHPIYIFFDNTNNAGIMYFYSGDYQVVMNPDSSHLFRSNLALADISGLSTWDSSKVTSMYAMFVDSTISLTNVNALSRWDTSNVENMMAIFNMNVNTINEGYISSLNDISGLSNWDTSSVTTMDKMFWNNDRLSSFHGLEHWDVSNVTYMGGMFGMGPGRARYNNVVVDLSPLSQWNVSNVEDMSIMFQNNNIASFLPLSNWNVGNVKNFSNTFNQTSASTTTSLAGLGNWDVSSAENMSGMFSGTPSLTDASAINGWDIRGVVLGTGDESINEGFNKMFSGTPTRPTFTLRPGTWNSNGTFIPSS